jgi:hypothetical protein
VAPARVRLIPFIEQPQQLRFPIHAFQRVKPALSLRARLLCCRFQIQQQGFEGCRRSLPHAATACRSCWQASHASTDNSMISSGVDENGKLDPRCPGCPPDCFALLWRKLFGVRTKRSAEGGRWLLWLSFASLSAQRLQLRAQAAQLLLVVLDHGVLFREQRLLLLDKFVSLPQSFPQQLLLFSQPDQFFFDRHAPTLLALTPFGKSPANLGSYRICYSNFFTNSQVYRSKPAEHTLALQISIELICKALIFTGVAYETAIIFYYRRLHKEIAKYSVECRLINIVVFPISKQGFSQMRKRGYLNCERTIRVSRHSPFLCIESLFCQIRRQ